MGGGLDEAEGWGMRLSKLRQEARQTAPAQMSSRAAVVLEKQVTSLPTQHDAECGKPSFQEHLSHSIGTSELLPQRPDVPAAEEKVLTIGDSLS